ncbi:MAG TPA: RHS repeat-associated core domain-containing protein [Fibrobacteria bacterium]|nr:RHS repeat-associated core domain-containing protein [Fibrobacteria bacterium]
MESQSSLPAPLPSTRNLWLMGLSLFFMAQGPSAAQSSLFPDLPEYPSVEDIFGARIFEEPVVPVGGVPDPGQNRALAEALRAFLGRQEHEDASALERFVEANPESPWNASLLGAMGGLYYRTGAFGKSLDAWGRSWELSKAETSEYGRAVADKAVGEYAKMIARLGRYPRLEALLKEVGDRDIRGPSTENIQGAREALGMMKYRPAHSFRCGPVALMKVFSLVRPGAILPRNIREFNSTRQGTSLWQVRTEARKAGLDYDAAKRKPGSRLPLPAIVNWKVGHYAAVIGFENGRYHLKDPTFGDDVWTTAKVLDEEASGYFLVPTGGSLPDGWTRVGEKEAGQVWGKGATTSSEPGSTGPHNDATPPSCPYHGMPAYKFHLHLVSLNLTDFPVGYTPPRGPAVEFTLTYNQREAFQPSIFNFGNLGNKWTHDWITYLTDDPANPAANIDLFNAGGGIENYNGYSAATSSFAVSLLSQATLVRTSTSPAKYQRRLPDGSIEYFEKVDGATAFPRRIFLTKKSDPSGQSITFAYDAQFRVTSVTDALGQATTLSYAFAADPLKVTKVTDPFGRFATLEYNASKQLQKITDVLGLATQFTYGSGDFITSMTTPYGVTQFRTGANAATGKDAIRWAEVTDPAGNRERLEFGNMTPQYPGPVSIPAGMSSWNSISDEASTFYWDKKAMADAPGDYYKAHLYTWERSAQGIDVSTAILLSEQKALEGRVFYTYANSGGTSEKVQGMLYRPTQAGRILDDGSSQVVLTEYNATGNISKKTDPLGRSTTYGYAANGIDILTVKQTTGGISQLLDTYTWNTLHRPLTHVDAAGQKTTYTYNAQGQLLTANNAKNETTTLSYNTAGYLIKVQGPQAADSIKFTYDAFGRVQSRRNADGFTLQFAYDAFDRLTKVTYPDGTFEQYGYNKLDLETTTDRLGRTTRTLHNSLRQPVLIEDPLQRLTSMEWCACGEIKSLTDAAGNKTAWKRDVQGRILEKTYADGKKTQYAYETATSRLKTRTDAKGQVATYAYFIDDHLKSVAYANATVATAAVSYTYDAQYDRLKTMLDGTGTTTYNYNPINATPAIGAGMLANIDGPLSNDVIAFTYDALGRTITRAINGSNSTLVYDNLGRITGNANPLGSFTYKYLTPTSRPDSLLYPNGQKAGYAYFPNTGDFRLSRIQNLNPSLSFLSRFDYTYDAEGQIKTWTQQADAATAVVHNLTYDPADEVVGDVVKSVASGNPVVKNYAYGYDKAGNRTAAQDLATLNTFGYNAVNQLTGEQGGGGMRFSGTLSEAATVTLDGKAVPVSAASGFDGQATVRNGKDTVVVVAKDYSNNSRTNKYEVTSTGVVKTFAYDNNGNLAGDGTFTYEWDAENRLTAVVNGTLRSEFSYDGDSRRVRIVEKNGATVTSDKRFLWVGNGIAEERDAAGSTVTKRYYPNGVLVGTTKYFYTLDHLGSIREMTDNAGAVVARYEYDPYGTRTRVAGTLNADFGFTGHYLHAASGLYLTKYRAYSPGLGRWTTKDPIGFNGGLNHYVYVENDPINYVDPEGKESVASIVIKIAGAIYIAKKAWDAYKSWDAFEEQAKKAQDAQKKYDENPFDPANMEKNCEEANKVPDAIGNAAKNTPGTSLTGDGPWSKPKK